MVQSKEVEVTRGSEIESQASGHSMEVEKAARVQEVQAAFVMARKFPREEHKAELKILDACKRYSFADNATYSYPRGKETVSGESIRLAETMARYWGNLRFGFRELERMEGRSLVLAYCIDLETNVQSEREFTIEHRLELKDGKFRDLTSSRDIYEMVANQAQRRVRACILQQIPAHIREAALVQVRHTLAAGEKNIPLVDRIRGMVKAFAEVGVTQEIIEKRLGHKMETMTSEEVAEYHPIYKAIKDGEQKREDFFGVTIGTQSARAESLMEKISKELPEDEKLPFEKKTPEG